MQIIQPPSVEAARGWFVVLFGSFVANRFRSGSGAAYQNNAAAIVPG